MAYVEALKRGAKTYYYLTKNIRVSSKGWKKVRIYLGTKPPQRAEIARAVRDLESRLAAHAPPKKFAYLSHGDAETLQDLKEAYTRWRRRTPPTIQAKRDWDFVIRFTYHSNAIEGNRLTLRQTALILKDKVIPSGVRAQDYNEAVNGKECLAFLMSYRGGLNDAFLEKVNGILTKNTDVVHSGRIRFFEVHIEGAHHAPPPHRDVKKHLLNLYKWYSAHKRTLHPFELATLVHARIAWIHPFEDGNGRTARAIMNYLLMTKGFPMFFIPVETREDYYRTLEQADAGDTRAYVAAMLRLILGQIRAYGTNKGDVA